MQFYGGLGIYQHLVDFAGAGATVPLTGFGNLLAKGAIEKVQQNGLVGAFTGGTAAAAGGIAAAIFFWLYRFSGFKTKNEKTIRKVALPHFSSRRFEFPNKMRKSQRQ